MKENIEYVLKEVSSAFQADGGDLELVDVNDRIVTLKLKDACSVTAQWQQ